MEQRPNPEKLLERVKEEERQEKRGKLKIYLGAAPGVGKTYTMLQDAQSKLKQGLDVVVGLVESHGRQEIENLVNDFEIIPRQKIAYHDKELLEFDLDAVLKRNPGLILIDEMAHTNVPGLRHNKRWQDIREIIDRGIDVYTTLNVQHIESLNDTVSQIIHSRIKETVPDFMLETANIIELIDLPPEDLLKRLQEGKVYFSKQAALAADHFFRKGNLIALRELALRATAERVNAQVLLYRQGLGIKHIWPTKDKLLVCVGSSTESSKIVRSARHLATRLQAEWIAVHVDTPKINLSEKERSNAIQNLRLAEQLGARTQILNGFDIVKEVMTFAREQNVTQIVIGKHLRSRFREMFSKSLTDELVRRSEEIDVYIITGKASEYVKTSRYSVLNRSSSWKTYAATIAIVGVASMINLFLFPFMHTSNLIMVYLLGVTIVALFGQTGPSILASILSVLAYKFFFIPPFFTFMILDLQYFFTLLVMLIMSQVIGHLTVITRRQAEIARQSEQHIALLHNLSRRLASARGIDNILNAAIQYIGEIFNSEILVLLSEDKHLKIKAAFKTEAKLNDKELSVAQWVYDLGQVAGLGTDTLPFSDALYVPLLASQGTIGVLRLHPTLQPGYLFTPEQMHLLEACANQIAIAIEVDYLHDRIKKSELKTETDRVSNALLRAVSHDLRTPLVSVMGYTTTLMEDRDLDTQKLKKLGKDIYLELEQLNRLTNNLFQITYLETKSAQLEKKPNSLQEVINSVLQLFSAKTNHKNIQVQIPNNLPEIPLDRRLIQEVVINLLDNALKFTPVDTPIEIEVLLEDNYIITNVKDRGQGIVPDEVNKLFEKFYRGRLLTTERGLGLGLAICNNIIKAHGGKIWVANRENGGAVFSFTLPVC